MQRAYIGEMSSAIETEVKIPLQTDRGIHDKLQALGFAVSVPRVFEANTLYDSNGQLRQRQHLLRLREAGSKYVLTFKGDATPGPHKQREEIETTLGSAEKAAKIFERLGYSRSFRYEKFRTEFTKANEPDGVVTLDETPIGWFLEIEGPPEWIDRTARSLGFSQTDYVLDSYGKLYLADCQRRGVEPADMVFSS
jgi:adenylate cyclase class 2